MNLAAIEARLSARVTRHWKQSGARGNLFSSRGGQRQASTVKFERRTTDRRRSWRVYRYLDVALALVLLITVLVATNANHMQPTGLQDFLAIRVTIKNVLLITTFCLSWMGSFAAFGLYEPNTVFGRGSECARVIGACTAATIAVLLFPLTTQGRGAFRYSDAALFWAVATTAAVLSRIAMGIADRAGRERSVRRVIIVGRGPRAMRLAAQLQTDAFVTNQILGFIDTREAAFGDKEADCNLGFLDELEQTLMHTVVDEVMIALPIKSHYTEIENAIGACERAGVQSKYLADAFNSCLARPRPETSGSFPVMAMRVVHDDFRLVIKRAIDVSCVIVALPLVLPLGLCIAAAIKLTSRGVVFFSHERYGLGKRRFRMYKFRTMVRDAEAMHSNLELLNEASGPVFKIRNDPRITPLGRFLRKSSLDELPQLINVLRGEMSLVGPRPLATRDVARFSEPEQMRRFSVVPGLTCLWQIGGRSSLCFDDWMRLDLEYIDTWSMRKDFWILLRTIPAVVKGVGAT